MPLSASCQQILDVISRGPITVPELCARLGLARNAVVVQLQKLTADGLVRRSGQHRTGTVGKPGYVYELVPGTEDDNSEAYRPLVGQILAILKQRIAPGELAEILAMAGEGLARDAGLMTERPPRERLAKAVAVVNSLGACAEIIECTEGKVIVENRRCPFAHAVRSDACVCHAAAAFFSAATGLPFEQKCDRDELLTCRYVASVAKDMRAA